MKSNITPLPTYPGRKGAAGAYQKIISEIPKCERFIEAMCGSAVISSLVNGCERILNDIDAAVIDKIDCTGLVQVYNVDYKKLIRKFDSGNNTVFFFDPPYLFETRSYKGKIYRNEWEREDHIIFLDIVSKMKSNVMITHYPSKLYDSRLKGWRKVSYQSMTRAGVRTENIYMNFPEPILLQSYQYIGKNFTDRQRIKRKVARLSAKLEKEDPKERSAIISTIIDQFSYMINR